MDKKNMLDGKVIDGIVYDGVNWKRTHDADSNRCDIGDC